MSSLPRLGAVLLGALVSVAACGSSGNTYTSPTELSKCAVTFDAPASAVPAIGGSGTITLRTERECQWTAQPDVGWLTVTAGSTGQGDGRVEFTAGANSDPVARSGGIMLNGQRAQVAQAAAECRFELGSSGLSFPTAGGQGGVDVHASSALCAWTASSDAAWLTITSETAGKGTGRVNFTVAPTSGPPRSGSLTVAGLHFSVTQSEGCHFDVAPLSYSIDAGGGTRTVTITAGIGCAWTAASNVPWITITSPSEGSGNGALTFSAAATTGTARSGTLTVAGQAVTVVQGQGCSFAISADTQSIPATGGGGSVDVTAGGGCAWTATSNASWLSIASGASGTGNGKVTFTAAATTGPGRSGTLTIAGLPFTVNQGQGCTLALSATTASAPAAGANGAFDVRTSNGCGWTASSGASWITVTSGSSGTGNGTVGYAAAANTGSQRLGTITVGDQTFTLTQDASCSYSITPTSTNIGSGGASTSVNVTAPGGCTWNATTNVAWIGISSGASGSGNGTVQLAIAATNDAARTGTVLIAGVTFTVNQASGCSYSITPSNQIVPAGGGGGSFAVNASSNCAWSATTSTPWIAISGTANGSGNGSVQFTAASNTGGARTGTILVAGQTFTVSQDSSCTFQVSPDTITAPAAGGQQTETVTASAADCAWSSVSNAPWIAIVSGATGTGTGAAQLNIQVNRGPARTGTALIAGRTITVNQDSACTISIAPASQSMIVGGGTGTVAVTAAGGCAWTATSNVSWITITAGASGSGNGTVQFIVDPNTTGAGRAGTLTIGGQTFTLTQDGA